MAPPHDKTTEPTPASFPAAFSLTPDQRRELRHLSDLLHLLHHRNRNQHRRAVWYRHFATFRKQLSRLIGDLEALHSVPFTHTERARKKREDGAVKGRVEERLRYWVEAGLVGKWWRAFSQVVAEGRFAQVGVVLVGALGRVCGVLGVTGRLDEMGEVEVRGGSERVGREGSAMLGGGEERGRCAGDGDKEGGTVEDVGVSVSREAEEVQEDVPGPVGTASAVEKAATASSKRPASPLSKTKLAKKTKRKKAGGDAIDDLFRGLG